MKFATLAAWLQWLESCHPSEIDLGLARIRLVAERMALLTPSARVITVGGTNGKGSCVTACAALLAQAGHSVGVYTSPHLLVYNERVVVNGACVSDQELCESFECIFAACQEGDKPISLTYFEYGTLAALDIFRLRKVDVMVLEVGLGGRLDAVNLLDADVAVVTSIDIDHRDWLGDNREDIGFEKAGIYRAGRPAICADPAPPARLLSTIDSLAAKPLLVNRDFGFVVDATSEQASEHVWHWWGTAGRFNNQPLPQLPLPSLAAALEAVSQLGVALDEVAFARLARLRVHGRFQQLHWQGRELILDVAHNPAATAYLAKRVQQWRTAHPSAQVFAAVAMMSDKDRQASLANLQSLIDTWLLVELDVPRAASSEMLRSDLASLGVSASGQGRLAVCLQQLLAQSREGDLLLVFGSFFTVAEALGELRAQGVDGL